MHYLVLQILHSKGYNIFKNFLIQLLKKMFSNCWQNKVEENRQEGQDRHKWRKREKKLYNESGQKQHVSYGRKVSRVHSQARKK